jgi:hypothetical protein
MLGKLPKLKIIYCQAANVIIITELRSTYLSSTAQYCLSQCDKKEGFNVSLPNAENAIFSLNNSMVF